MQKAYSYLRFSKKSQADGDSLRRQTAASETYCERKSLVLDNAFTLRDLGVSAFKGKNADVGALGEFLRAVEAGRVPRGSVLIVESLDRLSRDAVGEAFSLWQKLLKAGVEIHTLLPERQYSEASLNDLTGLLEAIITMYRAHEESATKSERIRAGWQANREALRQRKPATKVCPSWLRLKEDRSGYEVIPERAKVVLRIHQLARDGFGYEQITQLLNREGVLPIGGKTARWAKVYVAKLLKTRAVIGEYQPHMHREGEVLPAGEPIPGFFPAIMSERDWRKTQLAIDTRRGQRGRRGKHVGNLFSGLIFDARDGRSMVVKARGGSERSTRGDLVYLVSSGPPISAAGIPHGSIPYLAIENSVLASLQQELTEQLLQDNPGQLEPRIAQLTEKFTDLTYRRMILEQAIEDDPDLKSLLPKVADINRKIKATSAELERLKGQQTNSYTESLGQARSIITLLRSCPKEQLVDLRTRIKGYVRSLVREMWVLVEGERLDKWATVQVFFHKGGWIRFTCHQHEAHTLFAMGHATADPKTADDLRQWRLQENKRGFPRPSLGGGLFLGGSAIKDNGGKAED